MSIFGAEFEKIWPKAGSAIKLSDFGKKLLKKCQTVEKPDASKIDIKEFIKKSSSFPVEFGTNTCRVISQPKERYPIIQQQIASAYPVIHERVLALYLAFLEHKCQYGNAVERPIYTQLSLTDFVTRLLQKRCATFCDTEDFYHLLTGEESCGGFKAIGSLEEKAPLFLAQLQSYDEMKLSAFLSVSSHTEFLNKGDRKNAGIIELDKSQIETEGVVVGLVGGRFQRRDVMESQDILLTAEQNTKQNGYGLPAAHKAANRIEAYRQLWTQFYEDTDFLYEMVKNNETKRFHKSPGNGIMLDHVLMKKRFTISFDTLLLEAESRAKAAGKQAYIHVVGIGLGVWCVVAHQPQIFLETFTQRLKALMPQLPHVAVAHFSWFKTNEWGELKHDGFLASAEHPNGGIRTFLCNRNPADKLPLEFKDMLVVVSYAWDSNSLPGNEFWVGSLTSSCDPSTACSTLITELHNAHINTAMVNGENLHIATTQNGVMHIKDYSKKYFN